MTTICLMILAFASGGYLMRWYLWGSCWDTCESAYDTVGRALEQCIEAMDESCQLRDDLDRLRDEFDDAGSYAFRLLEDRAFYDAEREQFLASYVPSAPPSDFFHDFERN